MYMEEGYSDQQFFSEVNTRLRDLEERQRLLNERILLTGKGLIEERDKNFNDIQNIKKNLVQLNQEMNKAKDFLQRITEQLDILARKEELMILQRQFDLFRNK